MSATLVPAIIPRSLKELKEHARRLAFSPEIHLDVVDGEFVPHVSWPYSPAGEPRAAANDLAPFSLEVDLMVASPAAAARAWLAAGADMFVFHIETIAPDEFASFAASTRVSIGICALNDTPLDDIKPYAEHADYMQVMGIDQIGAQGRPFDERALARIRDIKRLYPRLFVSVDGSVNGDTIPLFLAAGADRLVAGSAIVGAEDPRAAFASLFAQLRPQ